jgi:hypothetical protein
MAGPSTGDRQHGTGLVDARFGGLGLRGGAGSAGPLRRELDAMAARWCAP